MRVVNYMASVDEETCTGCKRCEWVCPPAAIKVVDKIAHVDAEKCLACTKCWHLCPEHAVTMIERSEEWMIGVDFDEADSAAIEALCEKAHFFPEQFVCACTLTLAKEVAAAIISGATTPEEVTARTGVRSGCAIYCHGGIFRLGDRITADLLRDYGKMLRLFAEMDECIAVLDGGRYAYYLHAGGIVFGALENAQYDAFDLSQPAAFSYFDMLGKMAKGAFEEMDHVMVVNPAIKSMVVNQAWPGIPMAGLTLDVPTFVVGRELVEVIKKDAANPSFMDLSQAVDTLGEAMEMAKEEAGTDKILVFDGSFGYVNLSPSLADELLGKAPAVGKHVEENLLPMWLEQRNIEPAGLTAS